MSRTFKRNQAFELRKVKCPCCGRLLPSIPLEGGARYLRVHRAGPHEGFCPGSRTRLYPRPKPQFVLS